jgi:predicted transcriptional regulator
MSINELIRKIARKVLGMDRKLDLDNLEKIPVIPYPKDLCKPKKKPKATKKAKKLKKAA